MLVNAEEMWVWAVGCMDDHHVLSWLGELDRPLMNARLGIPPRVYGLYGEIKTEMNPSNDKNKAIGIPHSYDYHSNYLARSLFITIQFNPLSAWRLNSDTKQLKQTT